MNIEKKSNPTNQPPSIENIPLNQTSPIISKERSLFEEAVSNDIPNIIEAVVFEGGGYPIIINKIFDGFEEDQIMEYKEKYKAIVEETYKEVTYNGGDRTDSFFVIMSKNISLLKGGLEEGKAKKVAGALASSPLLDVVNNLLDADNVI